MDEVIEFKPYLAMQKFAEYTDNNGTVSIKLKHLIIVLNNLEYKDVVTGKRILFDDETVVKDSSNDVSINGLIFKLDDSTNPFGRKIRTFGFLEKGKLKYMVIVPAHVWQNSDNRILEELKEPNNECPFTLYYQKDTDEEDLTIIRAVLCRLLPEQPLMNIYLPIDPIIHPGNDCEFFNKLLDEVLK